MTKQWHLTKEDKQWVARDDAGRRRAGADTKDEAVRETADAARRSRDEASVVIHLQNGRFEEERTYPRSADPRSSKG
jgi:hypothetical protein